MLLRSKILFGILLAIVVVAAFASPALAQCPLCRLSLEGSKEGAAMARGLDIGILVLLAPPVAIFCTIFRLAKKDSKKSNDDSIDT